MYTYSTRDLREAAFIWAQSEICVAFRGLGVSDKNPSVFLFQFEISADRDTFSNLLDRYMNQQASVEPKYYDQKMNNLRDNLRKAKS